MKTLKIFGLLLIAIFLANQANAQWPPVTADDTRTLAIDLSGMVALPVICDGEQVDFLLGPADVKVKLHFKNGELVWDKIFGAQNELVSQVTGEVFKVLTSEKGSYVNKGMAQENVNVWHFKAKGEQGSMYTGHMKSLWLGPGMGFEIMEAEVNCK